MSLALAWTSATSINFECIGSYTDAESKAAFENVLTNILSKALLNTTVQINLNTTEAKPLETDVSMFLYEAGTTNLKYTFVHTLNRKGLPDTLVLDPSLKYDLQVATVPPVFKSHISIAPHTHNVIQVPAGQGQLKITSARSPEGTILETRILETSSSKTLHVQQLGDIQKYLVGTYQLEILTLPRTYKEIQSEQSKLTSIDVTPAGELVYQATKGIVGQLFYERNPGQWEWVIDLKYNQNSGKIKLQLGTYFQKEEWNGSAQQMLENLYDGMETYGSGYSNWGLLLMRQLHPEKQWHVLNESAPMDVFKKSAQSNCLLSYHQQIPMSEIYTPNAISVCEFGVCHRPVQNIEEALLL